MKKNPIIILLLLLQVPINVLPGRERPLNQGKVLESLSFTSKILEKKVQYSIYLPPGYDYSTRKYPVVYLLHGYTDDETAWVQFGEVHLTADMAITKREIPPMVIVMPDAGLNWYINDYKGINMYEDMFFEELVPFIETTYRIRRDKEFRGIAGLSMGGYGSLMYSILHPDMYSSCAAFSAGVLTDEEIVAMSEEDYNRWFARLYGENNTGTDRLTTHWKKYSVLELCKHMKDADKNKVRFYIDCGDDDFLYKGNSMLHITMRDQNIPHEFRIRDGHHEWTYWRNHIIEGLKFIGEGFHR